MIAVRARPGAPTPLGATWDGRGTNFALYSEAATGVELCLFEASGEETRVRLEQRTEFVWHVYLEGIQPGQLYGYRVDGPWEPHLGHRFNPHNLLLDPYAKAVNGEVDWSKGGFSYDLNHPERDLKRAETEQRAAPWGVVVDDAFDWGTTKAPNIPMRKSIIYETHVKGLTMRHPEVPPELRGTYAGIATEPILRYFRELGVTAIELLPVHLFVDDQHLLERNLRNYWGYNSIGFLAPEVRYRAGNRVGDEVRQFKEMVKALHDEGIEVILDVVYNHTAEGNHLGPSLSLKGIDNKTYYRLAPNEPRFYFDYTGTGNSLNVHHPQTLRLIMDSLRYWVTEMHVDGFRFDLASTLARSLHDVDRLGSFFAVMSQDPALANVKLIAEPWDLGEGGYQVGHFPVQWSEWNGEYRDALRAFWRGDQGRAATIGYRLTGSADLYSDDGRKPSASINFIAAHDGFTLRDLVSYEHKHNEANGEDNRDGTDNNLSMNGGAEGDTDRPEIKAFRARQQRNFLATLLFSRGTPMICGGDEIGRTQRGNNNSYCQDNELNWYDWDLDAEEQKLLEFVRTAIRIRRSHPLLEAPGFVSGETIDGHEARAADWFRHDGSRMDDADWNNPGTSSLALFLAGAGMTSTDEAGRRFVDDDLLLVLNASDLELDFTLPALSDRAKGLRWKLLLDTAVDGSEEDVAADGATHLMARSLKLFARRALAPVGGDGASNTPTSTYRLQLHGGFGFKDARAITDYLTDLGIGAIYTSPILKARSGSTHGYDVVDHSQINPEIGTREEFDAWTRDLKQRGVGYVLDFVPNHMGVGGENAWWNDVLEHGPSSLFADHFDIDWTPPTTALREKVLLPVLGGQFGVELEAKRVTIAREGGALFVTYYASKYPASPRSYRTILEIAIAQISAENKHRGELASIVSSIIHLPRATSTLPDERAMRASESEVIKRRLATLFLDSTEIADAVDAAIAEVNDNADKLDAFLLDQNYRLASWRVAGDEINYRRFFDLNDLAAIRTEDTTVFADTHRLLLDLVAAGSITGLRLDHTDGLYDPEAYFLSLRDSIDRMDRETGAPLYVVAEKILEPDEEMPSSWAIAGTTGYDFLAASSGLFVDPNAETAFRDLYQSFANAKGYEQVVYESKRAIIKNAVSSEVHMLAHLLKRIADGTRKARDFSLEKLLHAIEQVLLAFPVYRSYVRPDGTSQPHDEEHVLAAIEIARERNPLTDRSVFDFLGEMLLLKDRSPEVVRFALRFQQLTSPVMAKGIEDTAMYRHALLISNNEVGCNPNRFAQPPTALHDHNVRTLSSWPLTLTTASTHDTKKSEDVRARIAALTEIPNEWKSAVETLHGIAAPYLSARGKEQLPSRADEYIFYQAVVGTLPHRAFDDDDSRADYTKRLREHMLKVAHEAKLATSWVAPNEEYEKAIVRFVDGALNDRKFSDEMRSLVGRISVTAASNSLALLTLRLASPGIPDVYQGTELWDFSLVDPDNRRPVDFARRRALLKELAQRRPEDLTRDYASGAIKLHVLREGLRLRKEVPSLFLQGSYTPLESSPHVIAFERRLADDRLIAVGPRLVQRLAGGFGFALGDVWREQRLELEEGAHWKNVFTGETIEGKSLPLANILRTFPVALLRKVP